jgi:hypothetical protein
VPVLRGWRQQRLTIILILRVGLAGIKRHLDDSFVPVLRGPTTAGVWPLISSEPASTLPESSSALTALCPFPATSRQWCPAGENLSSLASALPESSSILTAVSGPFPAAQDSGIRRSLWCTSRIVISSSSAVTRLPQPVALAND